MHDTHKDRIGQRLRADLAAHLSPNVSIEIIDTRKVAKFYGRLMRSALGGYSFRSKVRDGTMICWAILLDGRPYGVGIEQTFTGWRSVGPAFGFANEPSPVAAQIDLIWNQILRDVIDPL